MRDDRDTFDPDFDISPALRRQTLAAAASWRRHAGVAAVLTGAIIFAVATILMLGGH